MSNNASHSALPPAENNPAGKSAAPPAPAPSQSERPPRIVTVMHPAGIPAYAAEGLTLNKPLFARVTYRPTP